MKYRKLRIAWSVGWGVLCLLLIALWVRSYWRHDVILRTYSQTQIIGAASVSGNLFLQRANLDPGISSPGWHYQQMPVELPYEGFKWESSPAYWLVGVPIWFAIVLGLAGSSLPWLQWHFSLRTLLIGMTVVAVALGLIFALSR
jgi:hypothetical protein